MPVHEGTAQLATSIVARNLRGDGEPLIYRVTGAVYWTKLDFLYLGPRLWTMTDGQQASKSWHSYTRSAEKVNINGSINGTAGITSVLFYLGLH